LTKDSKTNLLEQFDISRDSKDVSQDKRSSRLTLREQEDLIGKQNDMSIEVLIHYLEKYKSQTSQVNELEVERGNLEERCNDLVNELENAQELRKKIEKNYQEEIRVLNEKIKQLNEYIDEMETKNNEKFRGSLTSEVYFY